MTEMLYRLTLDGIGIYEAYKKLLFRRYPTDMAKKLWKAIVDASEWLPKPCIEGGYDGQLASWFTEKGLEKFKKAVFPAMSPDIYFDEIEFDEKPLSACSHIIYHDKFQVVERV